MIKLSPHTRAIIFGCAGPVLSNQERELFQRYQPLGFILFERNCQTPTQVQQLVHDLKSCVDHAWVPILIDQEGGRVTRLKPPHWRQYPPAALFGEIAQNDLDLAKWCVKANAILIGHELKELGININCAPVLDLPVPKAHPIISDRAFSDSIEIAAELAESYLQGLKESGIIGVIKHLPGHGRALADSHESLPIITSPQESLIESDFLPFKKVCQVMGEHHHLIPWGMTAHIVYQQFDPDRPATYSSLVIQTIIRDHIGFQGCLLSDCITMKALTGTWQERVDRTLKGGCDVVLHCSGHFQDMLEVAAAAPTLSTEANKRISQTILFPPLESIDLIALEAELQGRLKLYLEPKKYIQKHHLQ
jgi:beta-N-acetylhexosaminidase